MPELRFSNIPTQDPSLETDTPQKPLKKWRSVLAITFIVFLALSIAHYASSSPAKTTGKRLTPLKPWSLASVKNLIFPDKNIMIGQENDRINILLLGIGGSGHDGPYLSDTNIIVSIKPSTKQVAMISIPRDLAVKVPNFGYRKINSVDAIGENLQAGGGAEYARIFFGETFGIDIPYYIRVDFKAFTELIDQVGGVTVDVPKTFTDSLYPGPNDSYQTVNFAAGSQTLNGERALIYARSRHGNNGEGSDFARAKRQQQVLLALKEKMLSLGTYINPLRIQGIFDSVANNVITNLNFDQLVYLAGLAKDIDQSEVKNLVLDNRPNGFLVDGESFMLYPKGGNFLTINAAIADIFTATTTPDLVTFPAVSAAPANSLAAAKLEVQNGTWQAGLAARMKKNLEEKGFNVPKVGNSVVRPIASTALYIVNPAVNKDIITNLERELSIKSSPWQANSGTTNSLTPDSSTDILIIIGSNYFNQ